MTGARLLHVESGRRSEAGVSRVAILADCASQLLGAELRAAALNRGLELETFENPPDRIEQAVVDPSSDLHLFEPEFVIVWRSSERLLARYRATPRAARTSFADSQIEFVKRLSAAVAETLSSRLVYCNLPELDDGVFGSFANKAPESWVYQLRRLNYLVAEFASLEPDFFVADLSLLSADYGTAFAHDRRFALTANLALSPAFLPVVAARIVDIVAAVLGRSRKCLILDLDNTLWGGVLGEDDLEHLEIGELGLGAAYDEIQAWARELKQRGILLAVCSKNDEEAAAEVFDRHPAMTLKRDDFAAFLVNWQSKVDNLRRLQALLGIGFEAMVFVDDDSIERASVRASLPAVCVPELPADPVEVMPCLRRLNLFEAASLTPEDSARTTRYQDASRRSEWCRATGTEQEFLEGLGMVAAVDGFTPLNIPRVAQLTQRSNQFNLRTVRFGESELQRIAQSARHVPLTFTLRDRFGDYGLVSIVILEEIEEELFVDTWLMSCRVIHRGLEHFALDVMVEAASRRNARSIVGEYLPTARNAVVKDHYARLGFQRRGDQWVLDVNGYWPRARFIARAG